MRTLRFSLLVLSFLTICFIACTKDMDLEVLDPVEDFEVRAICLDNSAHPDLQPALTLCPRGQEGEFYHFEFMGQIKNIGQRQTFRKMRLIMAKDERLVLDNASTEFSAWQYDASNRSFHIWTSNEIIASGDFSPFKVKASYDMKYTSGISSFTLTVLSGSGGEINYLNNSDSVVLEY